MPYQAHGTVDLESVLSQMRFLVLRRIEVGGAYVSARSRVPHGRLNPVF